MKKLLFLILCTAGFILAQDTKVFQNDTLRNSELDTSAVIKGISMFKEISGYFTSDDSTNGILRIDYRCNDGETWATAAPETITVASATGAGYGTAIRSQWNDKAPGAHQFRFRFETLASGNNTQAAVRRYSFTIGIEK
jgi:hypothetical protein